MQRWTKGALATLSGLGGGSQPWTLDPESTERGEEERKREREHVVWGLQEGDCERAVEDGSATRTPPAAVATCSIRT